MTTNSTTATLMPVITIENRDDSFVPSTSSVTSAATTMNAPQSMPKPPPRSIDVLVPLPKMYSSTVCR